MEIELGEASALPVGLADKMMPGYIHPDSTECEGHFACTTILVWL